MSSKYLSFIEFDFNKWSNDKTQRVNTRDGRKVEQLTHLQGAGTFGSLVGVVNGMVVQWSEHGVVQNKGSRNYDLVLPIDEIIIIKHGSGSSVIKNDMTKSYIPWGTLRFLDDLSDGKYQLVPIEVDKKEDEKEDKKVEDKKDYDPYQYAYMFRRFARTVYSDVKHVIDFLNDTMDDKMDNSLTTKLMHHLPAGWKTRWEEFGDKQIGHVNKS